MFPLVVCCVQAINHGFENVAVVREMLKSLLRNGRDLRIVMITEASEDKRDALEHSLLDV
jgi:hypothetical protein